MSLRAVLSSRSLVRVVHSAPLLRALTTRSRLGAGIVARNGFQNVSSRGFKMTAMRAYAAPAEGSLSK
jgi:hypothetical protein